MSWSILLRRIKGLFTSPEKTCLEVAQSDKPLGIWRLSFLITALSAVYMVLFGFLIVRQYPNALGRYIEMVPIQLAMLIPLNALLIWLGSWISAILITPIANYLKGHATYKQTFRAVVGLYPLLYSISFIILLTQLFLMYFLGVEDDLIRVSDDSRVASFTDPAILITLFLNVIGLLFTIYFTLRVVAAINGFSRKRALVATVALPSVAAVVVVLVQYLTVSS